jgi:3-oxoacyl-[acyl-carrier protein] reductase
MLAPPFRTGMTFHEEVRLTPEWIEAFAAFSGDRNPLHLDPQAAQAYGFAQPVAHGAIQTAVVSRLIGMKVPGPGAIWMSQSMEWLRPAFVGDTIRVEAEIASYSSGAEVMTLNLEATNSRGETLMRGQAKVKLAPRIASQPRSSEPEAARVALVTGASRGIGAAAARALAACGCQVAIAYKSDREKAERLRAELEDNGRDAVCLAADLMAAGAGTELVKQAEARFGRLDILVHAATQSLPAQGVLETTAADLRNCLRIQVEAAHEMAQAAAPGMAERGFGRMVFLGTSSLFGQPPPKLCAYITAKQALWGLTRCLATELGPRHITVNLVSPGMTVTELTADVPQRLKEVEARRVPVRRLALPEDAAGLIAFLASEQAAYLNGQNLPLTGGPV